MKNEDKTYYLNKSIELSEDNKKTLTIDSDIIFKFPNDNELGKEIRRLVTKKVNDCDIHIKQMNDLIQERSK
jgi:hypothetical protein